MGPTRRQRWKVLTKATATMTISCRRLFCGCVFTLAISVAPAVAATVSGRATVIDGDTLTIGAAQIRIHGIDAPEAGQKCERSDGRSWGCDEAAMDLMTELVDGRDIACEVLEVDVYGRLVSRCAVDGTDVGAEMMDHGLAWAFVRYSDDYLANEAAARAARIGIWRDGAEPTTPWDYRADRWNRASSESPREGCPIKGNIARDGEKNYHTPWSPWYGRTQINEAAGERWFCDEAEAVAEGWRAARPR